MQKPSVRAELVEAYEQINPLLIQTNVPLADKNWFKTGGAARFYCEPTTTEQFQEAIIYAATHNLPIFMLGQGANILISDDGFDGLVIRPTLVKIEILRHPSIHFLKTKNTQDERDEESLVKADAGVTMPDLIDYCLNNNLMALKNSVAYQAPLVDQCISTFITLIFYSRAFWYQLKLSTKKRVIWKQ